MSSPRDQGYFPPIPPDNRRRSSSAAAGRYTPREYAGTPQQQSHGQYLDPNHQPFPPAGTPLHTEPPYPDESPAASPHMNMPLAPRRPSASELHFRRDETNLYQEALRRPSYSGSNADRRLSHDSRRSHHSHHSHHSHNDDRRRHRHFDDDVEDDNAVNDDFARKEEDSSRHRPHHHNHRGQSDSSIEAYRQRQKDRGENVSRSLGGSLMSVFYPLKYLFEPRDKY